VKKRRGWAGDFARLTLRQARRLVILVFGATVVLLGALMLFTPGPGFLVVFLGLGLLALEFAWARRLLGRAKSLAHGMADRIRNSVSGDERPR